VSRIPVSDEGPGEEWFDPAEVLADVE